MLIATELLVQRLMRFQEAGQSQSPEWMTEQGQTLDWLGLPLVWGWTEVSDPKELLNSSIPVISAWMTGPYTTAEIERAKERVRSRLEQGAMEREVQAEMLGWSRGWKRLEAELGNVDSDSVSAAMLKHLKLSELRVLMGPALQTEENDADFEEMKDFSVEVDMAPGYDWNMGVPIHLSLQEP